VYFRAVTRWISILVGLATATPLSAAPFLTRDQNPLTGIYGQPLPMTGRLPADGSLDYAISLDIANSINSEQNGSEDILLDYESYALTLSLQYSPGQDWALQLEAPLLYRGAGTFDSFIDGWHTFWGLPNGQRPLYPEDQYRMTYADAAGVQFDITDPGQGLGDIQLGLGYQLSRTRDSAMSLWLSADLPTGDREALTGNGSVDISILFAGSNRSSIGSNSANIGVVFPGDSVVNGLETRSAVVFGHVQGGWDVNDSIELKLQLQGHSGYYSNTDLNTLGSALVLVFGGRIKTSPCSGIDIGFSEDIKVGASPDIAFLLSWSSTTGQCRQP
jgi:hypothetical protein